MPFLCGPCNIEADAELSEGVGRDRFLGLRPSAGVLSEGVSSQKTGSMVFIEECAVIMRDSDSCWRMCVPVPSVLRSCRRILSTERGYFLRNNE